MHLDYLSYSNRKSPAEPSDTVKLQVLHQGSVKPQYGMNKLLDLRQNERNAPFVNISKNIHGTAHSFLNICAICGRLTKKRLHSCDVHKNTLYPLFCFCNLCAIVALFSSNKSFLKQAVCI